MENEEIKESGNEEEFNENANEEGKDVLDPELETLDEATE